MLCGCLCELEILLEVKSPSIECVSNDYKFDVQHLSFLYSSLSFLISHIPTQKSCEEQGQLYYQMTSFLGCQAYTSSQHNACECRPLDPLDEL